MALAEGCLLKDVHMNTLNPIYSYVKYVYVIQALTERRAPGHSLINGTRSLLQVRAQL